MLYLLNSFPNALYPTVGESFILEGITLQEAQTIIEQQGFVSYVGHANFAKVLENKLGVPVPVNRGEAPKNGRYVVAAVTPPRRLGDAETWTEEEILGMHVGWYVAYPATKLLAKAGMSREPYSSV